MKVNATQSPSVEFLINAGCTDIISNHSLGPFRIDINVFHMDVLLLAPHLYPGQNRDIVMITFHTNKPIYLYERENRILLNETNKSDVVQKNQNIHINRDDLEIDHSKAGYIPGSFITTWKTTARNEEITIPTNSVSGPYHYSVDWGDDSTDSDLSGDATHRHASPGIRDFVAAERVTGLTPNEKPIAGFEMNNTSHIKKCGAVTDRA